MPARVGRALTLCLNLRVSVPGKSQDLDLFHGMLIICRHLFFGGVRGEGGGRGGGVVVIYALCRVLAALSALETCLQDC